MDQTTLFNGLIVLVIALVGLLVGGGVAIFVTIGRQNKNNLELAYKALPPDWQAFLRDLIVNAKSIADLADEVTTPASTPPALPSRLSIPAPVMLSPEAADKAPG